MALRIPEVARPFYSDAQFPVRDGRLCSFTAILTHSLFCVVLPSTVRCCPLLPKFRSSLYITLARPNSVPMSVSHQRPKTSSSIWACSGYRITFKLSPLPPWGLITIEQLRVTAPLLQRNASPTETSRVPIVKNSY